MYNKVNIRVYKRGFKGTIFIWNTDPLTDEQRRNYVVYVRRTPQEDWIIPETTMPDVLRMGRVKDDKTDTIMVMHNEQITMETQFMLRLVFGKGETDFKESFLTVEPANAHKMYTKPERVVLPTGKTVYAENANVVSMADEVIEKIASKVKEKLDST